MQDLKTAFRIPHRNLHVSALTSILLLIGFVPVSADETTYNVSFSANSFQIGSGPDPAPVDPVVGQFLVTLDPTLSYTNNTANISLTSLNISLGSSLCFTYKPTADGSFSPGVLRVGGLNSGSDVITFNPSTNDFWLFINDFDSSPSFEQLGYTQTSVSNNNLFFTLNQTGSVNVSTIPEPATAGLCFLFMVVAAVATTRRRSKLIIASR